MATIEEEKKEVTLEEILQQFQVRIQNLEGTLGYIIKTLEIKPPPQEEPKE